VFVWRLAVLVVLTPDFKSGAARIGLGVRLLCARQKVLLGAASVLAHNHDLFFRVGFNASSGFEFVLVADGILHIVVGDLTGASLWHYFIDLSTSVTSDWKGMDGSSPSAPTLTSYS